MDYSVTATTNNECDEVTEPEYSMVNHPKHYNRDGAIECIDEMELIFGPEMTMHFCLGCVFKYRYRAGLKDNGYQDLEKSDWYMARYKELKEKISKQNATTTSPYTIQPWQITPTWREPQTNIPKPDNTTLKAEWIYREKGTTTPDVYL